MLKIQQQKDNLVIELRVQPKSSADRIIGEHDGALKIGVTAAPESGKANDAVIKLLSKLLDVPKSNIEIISGHSSRNKRVAIKGVIAQQIRAIVGD